MTTALATVTRTELSLGPLDLITSTYDLRSLEAGEVTWRREEATSPYVDGAIQIGAVLGKPRGRAVVRVKAADHSALQTAISTVVATFKQSTYTLALSLDSSAYTWLCDCADYSTDFDIIMRRQKVAMVVFSFPRSPTPVNGPF